MSRPQSKLEIQQCTFLILKVFYPFILSPKYPLCTFLAEVKNTDLACEQTVLSAQVRALQLSWLFHVLTGSLLLWEPPECKLSLHQAARRPSRGWVLLTPQEGRGCGCLDCRPG